MDVNIVDNSLNCSYQLSLIESQLLNLSITTLFLPGILQVIVEELSLCPRKQILIVSVTA